MEEKEKREKNIEPLVDNPDEDTDFPKKPEEEKVSVVDDLLHIMGFQNKKNEKRKFCKNDRDESDFVNNVNNSRITKSDNITVMKPLQTRIYLFILLTSIK